MGRRTLVEITMTYHHQTEAAILMSLHGIRDDAVWLPKSAVEVDGDLDALLPGQRIEVTLPEELAIRKEIV